MSDLTPVQSALLDLYRERWRQQAERLRERNKVLFNLNQWRVGCIQGTDRLEKLHDLLLEQGIPPYMVMGIDRRPEEPQDPTVVLL